MSGAPLDMGEFKKQSEAYYSEIKSGLESTHKGQYVALDFESKQHWIGASASEALVTAKAASPDKLFYLIQIGSSAAFSIQSLSRGEEFGDSYDTQWAY